MSQDETADTILRMIRAGSYVVDGQTVQIDIEQTKAVRGTRLYTPETLVSFGAASGTSPAIRVTDGTTQTIACELAASVDGHVGLLNFASARNPGGGFLNGAVAQEEDLCRCSGLYPCLLQCMEYYEANRGQSSLLYTDHAIFSPAVPFFKTRGRGEYLKRPFFVSVITAPAPNSGPFLRAGQGSAGELKAAFLRRWKNVLRIARDQNISHLLLGAWGCGAFGGNPVMASETAREAICSDGAGITEIVFAIPGQGRQSRKNLDAFRATFR